MSILDIIRARIICDFPEISDEELLIRMSIVEKLLEVIK
jgi:hypothetical protein